MYMEPVSGKKAQDTSISLLSMVESTIENYSGKYNCVTLYDYFSKKMTQTEFHGIIDNLIQSGKIVIDREGKICWIWNSALVKEIIENKKFAAFRHNT